MAAKRSSAVLKKVLKLADTANENRIELALALCELEEAKPGEVAKLVKTRPKERRKLYYLLDVGKWLRPVGQPMSRYAAIGWTKLAILAEHSRNHPGTVSARKGLTYAEQCTAKELPAVLDGAPLPEKGKKSHHSVHFRLTFMQYKVFEAAMRKNGYPLHARSLAGAPESAGLAMAPEERPGKAQAIRACAVSIAAKGPVMRRGSVGDTRYDLADRAGGREGDTHFERYRRRAFSALRAPRQGLPPRADRVGGAPGAGRSGGVKVQSSPRQALPRN
jgi:hypothetical protein